jgi:hypothetical protein
MQITRKGVEFMTILNQSRTGQGDDKGTMGGNQGGQGRSDNE